MDCVRELFNRKARVLTIHDQAYVPIIALPMTVTDWETELTEQIHAPEEENQQVLRNRQHQGERE
jgi:hypothetical protein